MKKTLLILVIYFTGCVASFSQGSWTSKMAVTGGNRCNAVGYAIGNKGYVSCGVIGTTLVNDLQEYDVTANTWTTKAPFPGITRQNPVGFSIGSKGYVGMGSNRLYPATYYLDFFEYDAGANTWTAKASFPGAGRLGVYYFSIGGKGYVGGGYSSTNYSDLWEYNPSTNTWTAKNSTPFPTRAWPCFFTIGNKGYVAMGMSGTGTYLNDLWEYNPSTDSWVQKANFPGTARYCGTGFSSYNYGYIATGYGGSSYNDLWQYNPSLNMWTQCANFPGSARSSCISFSINNKGYLGTGYIGTTGTEFTNDLWEYTPAGYGIPDNSNNLQLIIYPCPTSGTLYFSGLKNETILFVYDIKGKLITTSKANINKLDVSNLKNGVYFIKLESEEGSVVKKFVKE